MKKVLASDYDGTLFIDGRIDEEAKEAIKMWRSSGNYFGIVTGRDIRMTKDAIENESLEVDFIVCNNGTAIYDNEYRLIKDNYLPEDIVLTLIEDYTIKSSHYIVLADELGRYVYDEHKTHYGYERIYYTELLNRKKLNEHKRIYQMDTRFDTPEEILVATEKLQLLYGDRVTINPNITTIDITPLGVTKLTGLIECLRLFDLEKYEIITVGDGFNDLTMLEHYKGYTMEWAVDKIKEKLSTTPISSVKELIDIEIQEVV